MFGGNTRNIVFSSDPFENSVHWLYAMEEAAVKLRMTHFAGHDNDALWAGISLKERALTMPRIEEVLLEIMDRSGLKPLWWTQDLFTAPVFRDGAATSPYKDVQELALAQAFIALRTSKIIGAPGHTLWGGREGFGSLLNTRISKELDAYANFIWAVYNYGEKIGYKGDYYIEPKTFEPTIVQYDADVATIYAFLQHYGFAKTGRFKINFEVNHGDLGGKRAEDQVALAIHYGILGSIDGNQGDSPVGFDTDRQAADVIIPAKMFMPIIASGGLGKGGINWDAKARGQSHTVEDLFHGKILSLDTYAQGYMIAMHANRLLEPMLNQRYSDSVLCTDNALTDPEAFLRQMAEKQPLELRSGQQEYYERLFNKAMAAAYAEMAA